MRHRIDDASPLHSDRFKDLAFMNVELRVFDTAFMQETRICARASRHARPGPSSSSPATTSTASETRDMLPSRLVLPAMDPTMWAFRMLSKRFPRLTLDP